MMHSQLILKDLLIFESGLKATGPHMGEGGEKEPICSEYLRYQFGVKKLLFSTVSKIINCRWVEVESRWTDARLLRL